MNLNKMKTTIACVVAFGALALSACAGGPCEQVCAKFNACTLDERDHDVECNAFCLDEQSFEHRAEVQGADTCATEFDAYVGCFATNQAALCDATSTACEEALTAYTDCAQKFCDVAGNNSDPACIPVEDDDGNVHFEPSFAGF